MEEENPPENSFPGWNSEDQEDIEWFESQLREMLEEDESINMDM